MKSDLEANDRERLLPEDDSKPLPSASSASFTTAAIWLTTWLVNNIGVTLLNKSAFQFVHFPYPYTLSAVHMLCNGLGAAVYYSLNQTERRKRKSLTWEQFQVILAFSVVFALNIAIGNASLKYVSVNFNQVMRSLVPGVVMILGTFILKKHYSYDQRLSLIPVILGVMLACFGEMHFSTLGFAVTCLCVLLAAAKVVASNLMLTGDLKLAPMDLLSRMCPLAFLEILVMGYFAGEITSIRSEWDELAQSYAFPIVLTSGVASFTLNLTSLFANKMTSPLTLSVTANAKQVLMIGIATLMFGTPINAVNGLGIIIVLAGSAWYSSVSYRESQKSTRSTGA